MSDEKFHNKYRIPSARAIWHDYGGGAYFVTVCTKNHEHYFGKIASCRDAACHVSTTTATGNSDPQMQLSPVGQYLHEIISEANRHNPYCEIPLFVVMPNHFHAIVFIDGEKTPYQRRHTDVSGRDAACRDAACHVSTETAGIATPNRNAHMQKIANMQGWLSVVVGGIKSAVTKFARENSIEFAWQTRFDDRIIRDQDEMNRIADYIENNAARWSADCFNDAPPP
jgi:REP element-mobilizing transposase RayT